MLSEWCILSVVAFRACGEEEAEAAYCWPLGRDVLGVADLWPAVKMACPVLHADSVESLAGLSEGISMLLRCSHVCAAFPMAVSL